MVARQPLLADRPRRAQPLQAHALAQQPTHPLVGDLGVQHDLEDLVQQRLAVLPTTGPLGQGLGQPHLRHRLPARQRLVEQQQRLVQHVDRRLRHQRQQDRVATHPLTPLERLRRQAPANPGQKPPPLGRQRRQVQRVRIEPAQVGHLLQLGLDRPGRGLRRPDPQPGQPGAAQQRIHHQQLVELGAARIVQQVLNPRPRLRPGLLAGGGDALQQVHQPRPDQPRRGQVLARQPKQQPRRVVLHRPGEQELPELLPCQLVHRPPAQVPGHLAQMVGAGLLPHPVPAQRTDRDPQPLRQPRHRGRRRRPHLVGHKPQPRQHAQLHRRTQRVALPTEPPHERLVGASQGEVPDQLCPVDLREAAKLRQLLVGEHVTSRHRESASAWPLLKAPASYAKPHRHARTGRPAPEPGANRWFCAGSYGEA